MAEGDMINKFICYTVLILFHLSFLLPPAVMAKKEFVTLASRSDFLGGGTNITLSEICIIFCICLLAPSCLSL